MNPMPEFKRLSFTFNGGVLEHDTGWKYAASARPNRGLHDYERTITFRFPLDSSYYENKLEQAIQLLDNPGYCNWSFRKQPDGRTFKLTSTCDSSD